MEYFLGSFITLVCVFFVINKLKKEETKKYPVQYTQTRAFYLLKEILAVTVDMEMLPMTQSLRWEKENTMRVFCLEDNAYWIKNNTLFVGKIIDGIVDHENAVQVDTMGMDNVQLKQTIFIVEKLREGLGDDNWNPRYKEF